MNLRPVRTALFGMSAWILSIVLALQLGAVSEASTEIIAQLRLPRALLASAVGMGLSVAGAVLQALFANPLCEPYTLGISSGAALGAVIGAALGLHWFIAGVAGSALLGALVFTLILVLVSRHHRSNNLALLLTGVMMGFLGSGLVALWMALADPSGIQGALFWLLGDLSRARLQGSTVTLAGSLILIILLWRRYRDLDGFLMGEEGALSLGIAVGRSRTQLVFFTALLIALCVSSSGMIGFIGLIIPHFVRRSCGSLHRHLIPICAIWGAAALTLADTISRFAFQPYEIPVGVVMALSGAPLFLFILLRRQESS